LLYDELEVAAHRGLPERMKFLAELGLDLDQPVGRSRQTPAQLARRKGHDEVLAVLTNAGANTKPDSHPDP
jgi:ankyrin repeat protein